MVQDILAYPHLVGTNGLATLLRPLDIKKLSVVVPCFNEADGLSELVSRLTAACEGCAGKDYEIILVNDGSSDGTWQVILELSHIRPQIVGVDLARNHGHQLALTAGLTVTRGERILVIDADLQDPPELLPKMMAELDGGGDVAYGQRSYRDGETWFKRASATFFYRLLRCLTDEQIPADSGDFRLMKRKVLEVLLSMPEQHRFIRGMVAWIGFRQVAIPYKRAPRFAGTTKYTLRKMLRFATDAITGFSVAPLRLSLHFALGSIAVAFLLSLYATVMWLRGTTAPGWASIAIIVLAFGSVQMLCLGIMGEYLGRIYTQSKQRPLFIIRSIHQGGGTAAADTRAHELCHGDNDRV